MKINSTAQYLSLISRALDKDVLPSTNGDNAKQAIQTIQTTLSELHKRQGISTGLLQQCILEGEKLKADLEQCIPNNGTKRRKGKKKPHDTKTTPIFDALVPEYNDLTHEIDQLCVIISEYSPRISEAEVLLRRAAEWEYTYYAELQKLEALPFGDAQPHHSPHTASPVSPLSMESLQEYLQAHHGPIQVVNFAPVLGGFGKQTFMCTIKNEQSETLEDLVIRKMDPVPIMEYRSFNLELEYDMLRCLSSKTSFPVPRLIGLAIDPPGVDGSFYIMEKVPGKVLGTFFGDADGGDSEIPEGLILSLAEHLAHLHRYPLTTFSEYFEKHETSDAVNETVTERYRRNLRSWREYAEQVEHSESPFCTWLFDWLENNLPDDNRRSCLTHGDFYIHNVLANGDQITAILDWECADFGAPEQDLAYTQPLVSKHVDWQKFLERYKQSGGYEVNEAIIPFCRAYGAMRIYLGGSRATVNLQQGTNRDIRYVMAELGFTPSIMQMVLANTSHQQEPPDVTLAEPNGHSPDAIPALTINGSNGHQPSPKTDVVIADNGIILPIFGDEVNIRQQPGAGETWQNSVVLTWWDDENKIGGFHRLGHEPNRPDGGRVPLWNFVTGPDGSYHACSYNPLRKSDTLEDGSFGSGDGTCRMSYHNGAHIWTISDQDIEAQIKCTDLGPNIDCYPKKGSINKGFTSAHFDIPVSVGGTVSLKGRQYHINGLGVRDNGWGARDWNSVFSHRWVVGTAGKDFFFCAVTWHSIDEAMAKFAWVVRDGRVTFAEEVDVLANMEMDAATNRGGQVRLTLTTGEVLHIECIPCTAKATASFHPAGVCVVDRLCTFRCGSVSGMCDFETTSNIQLGSRRPAKFSNAIIENGFFS